MTARKFYTVPSRSKSSAYLFAMYLVLSLSSLTEQKPIIQDSVDYSLSYQAKPLTPITDQFRPSLFSQVDLHNSRFTSFKNSTEAIVSIIKQKVLETKHDLLTRAIHVDHHLSLESILQSIRILRI